MKGDCDGTSLAPACIKMYYQINMVYEKNGIPTFTINEDTTTAPTAFEFIPTGYVNEYLIRKYDEDKFLTYKSPSQPSYVEFKSKSLSDAMSDDAFHFNILLDGNLERIQHVKTGLYLSRANFDTESRNGIMFRDRTPDVEDSWWFKFNIVECEVGEIFERNDINTYGVYDEIEFPANVVSRILFDFWIIYYTYSSKFVLCIHSSSPFSCYSFV